jgi:hypothetical protein
MEVDKSSFFVNCEHTLVPLFFGLMAASKREMTYSVVERCTFDRIGQTECD